MSKVKKVILVFCSFITILVLMFAMPVSAYTDIYNNFVILPSVSGIGSASSYIRNNFSYELDPNSSAVLDYGPCLYMNFYFDSDYTGSFSFTDSYNYDIIFKLGNPIYEGKSGRLIIYVHTWNTFADSSPTEVLSYLEGNY